MIDSLDIIKRRYLISDTGPFYHEFEYDSYVLEPWNAYSSLAFFIPVLFWILRLRGEYMQNKFIVAMLPFLFMNGLGSTLYHAFRNSQFFLILDWMPAAILMVMVCTFFWTRIVGKWYYGLGIVIGAHAISVAIMFAVPKSEQFGQFAPNIGYFIDGCLLFVPILIDLYRTHFKYGYLVVLSMLFLGLALMFRTLDYPTPNPFPSLLPQGTHFLWHVCSSFAVFSLGFFIYYTKRLTFSKSEHKATMK